jgi:hypothetical protein
MTKNSSTTASGQRAHGVHVHSEDVHVERGEPAAQRSQATGHIGHGGADAPAHTAVHTLVSD